MIRKTLLATTLFAGLTGLAQAQVQPSANNTVVVAGSNGSIVDADGSTWTIANGLVLKNGALAGYSKSVTQIAYVNGTVWQQNAAGRWWAWNGTMWPGYYGTATSPVSSAATSAHTGVTTAPPSLVPPTPAPCPTATGGTGRFQVQGGQIIGPDGRTWVARGVNTGLDRPNHAEQIQAVFPGVNFVRLAVNNYPTPDTLAPIVSSLAGAGIVVEIEDHHSSDGGDRGGAMGSVFTGPQLTTELNWYSSIASAFRNNPYVWFGTNNEPPGPGPALSAWQKQTYAAIRSTGNNNPIMLEAGVGATPMGGPLSAQLTASAYMGMTNVVWDMHFYGWVSGYNTDQSAVSGALANAAQQAQTITSADGVIPVHVGEYGNSTTGTTIDPNGTQVIAAVITAGSVGVSVGGTTQRLGSSAWIFGTGNPGDGLLDAEGRASVPYGQMVQLYVNTSTVEPTQCQADQQAQATLASIAATVQQTLTDPAPQPNATPAALSDALATSTAGGDQGAANASASVDAAIRQVQALQAQMQQFNAATNPGTQAIGTAMQ